MDNDIDILVLNRHIKSLKETALAIQSAGALIPAIEKNTERILACIKMLELNMSDIIEFEPANG